MATLVPWMKRGSRKRTLAFPDALMKIIMCSVEKSRPLLVHTPAGKREVRMLLPNQKGGPWQPQDFRLAWNRMCETAGVSIDVVAAWLGHSTAETTRRSYLRYEEDEIRMLQPMMERGERLARLITEAKQPRRAGETAPE